MFYFVTFILVQPAENEREWKTIIDTDRMQELIDCLDDRGLNEHRLKTSLTEEYEGIRQIFKEREKFEEDQAEEVVTRSRRKSKLPSFILRRPLCYKGLY